MFKKFIQNSISVIVITFVSDGVLTRQACIPIFARYSIISLNLHRDSTQKLELGYCKEYLQL